MLVQQIGAAARPEGTRRGIPTLLTQGFRPFFLAAGLWAVVALAVWLVMLTTGMALPSRFDPIAWHIHEMLFGFVMAAVGGFVLTAIPNWTGRPSVSGALLGLLAGLWLLGRVVCLVSATVPAALAIAGDLAFPIVLAVVAVREIIAAGNWRNLPIAAPVAVLGAANLLMHLEAADVAVSPGLGWRLGLVAVVILISVIGGRIVPAFTRNWLVKQGAAVVPPPAAAIDRIALGFLHAGLVAWAMMPEWRPLGGLLLAAAAVNAWRLGRWSGLATLKEPLLFVLHIGYGWLIAGTALLGLATLDAGVPRSAAIHALTVGAFGTMIAAVMTRATRGHTGRALAADAWTTAIYALISGAAVLRILVAFIDGGTWDLLIASGSLWIAGFGLFLLRYGPILVRPPA